MPNNTNVSAPSPCIAVCIVDPANGYCRGCHRTLGEIGRWVAMTKAERLDLLDTIAQRRRDLGVDAKERERAQKRAERRLRRRRDYQLDQSDV